MRSILNALPFAFALFLCVKPTNSFILKCGNCSGGIDSLVCPDYINKQYELQMQAEENEPRGSLQIECGTLPLENFDLLDGCMFPSVSSVKFKLCPFFNESFASTFNQIGINSTKIKNLSVVYPIEGITTLNSDHLIALTNLTFLNLEMTQLTFIAEDVFQYSTNLKRFDLRGNKLKTLHSNTFKNLRNLFYLNLIDNSLTELPEDLLDKLHSLETVFFGSNNLENIPGKLFSNVTSLKAVAFPNNRIKSLPGKLFVNNTDLISVNFKRNDISKLPESLFVNNHNLEIVNFSYNKLTDLPEQLFSSNKFISTLELDNNLLTTLPEFIFKSLINVKKIKLSKNELNYLPYNLFNGLRQLEELDLSWNLLQNLSSGLFNTTTRAKVINLSNNNLLELPEYIFLNCLALEELKLQNNNISRLSFLSFPHESVLRHLDFSYNQLTAEGVLDPDIFALNRQINLEFIDFSYNEFYTFPVMSLYNFIKLQNLSFEGNFLEHLQFSEIFEMPYDSFLNLRHNRIVRITNFAVFDEKSVNVYLKGNNFTCDCQIYEWIKQVQKDSESSRNVYEAVTNKVIYPEVSLNVQDKDEVHCHRPENLAHRPLTLVNLEELECSISKSECSKDCPCVYKPIYNMVTIKCSNHKLRAVPYVKTHPRYGYTFDLSGNALSHFNLSSDSQVVNLSLSDNIFRRDDLNLEGILPPKLQYLDLSRNNLTSLSELFLMELNATTSLDKIDLTSNPWLCNCEIAPLHNFMQAHYMKVKNIRNIICQDERKPLIDMTEEDICPLILKPEILATIGVVTSLLILVAILGTISFYHYRTAIKVWFFTHRLCLWFVTEDELDNDKQYDAFISYSHKDEEFVNNILVHGLENGDPKYRICLHYRDWIVGEFIQSQIINSVLNSRRTIVVLSKNFIESVWGQMEFRAAHQQALKENTNRVIVIVHGEMPPEESLDEELRHYISMHTYLKWGHPRFWENLRYAMPHPKHLLLHPKQNRLSVDKLELVVNGHVKNTAKV